jgi:hypothetical protein
MEGVEVSSDLRDVAVQMVQAMQKTPAGVAQEWANIISNLCSGGQAAILSAAGEGERRQGGMETPEWAVGCPDQRAAMHWDTSQTVANCLVNGALTVGVVDTGSYKTLMDIGTARMLGLAVRESKGGDCGTYSVPGTGRTNCYAGVVQGPVMLQLGPKVRFQVMGMKLIDHPHPLMLIGSDVLSGGRPKNHLNFTGLRVETDENQAMRGYLCFARGDQALE